MAIAVKRVVNSYKELVNDPVEGFLAEIPDESNIMLWHIWMEGPPGSPYEGGIFQLKLVFPDDFPMSPPELSFISDFWHPNVYKDGNVCISILHPPGEDEISGELAGERWMPTQTVASIMLSVISMLNDPNLSSPANVEASVMWRDNKRLFEEKCAKLVELAKSRVPSHIKIPHPETNPDERKRAQMKRDLLGEDDMAVSSGDYGDDYIEDFSDDDQFIDEYQSSSDGYVPPRSKSGKKKDKKDKKSTKSTKTASNNVSSDAASKSHIDDNNRDNDVSSDVLKDGNKDESGQKSSKKSKQEAKSIDQSNEATDPVAAKNTKKEKDKKNDKKVKVEQEKIDDKTEAEESIETDSTCSSSIDSQELSNLLQVSSEFKSHNFKWDDLQILSPTSKGWVQNASKIKNKQISGSSPYLTPIASPLLKNGSLSLRIMTYNVLRHSTAEGMSRATEQMKILSDSNAHILVLNDVTPQFQSMLCDQTWISEYYAAYANEKLDSENKKNGLKNSSSKNNLSQSRSGGMNSSSIHSGDSLPKGPATLVLSKLKIRSAQVLNLPSRTDRSILRVLFEGYSSQNIVLLAAHLDDSVKESRLRAQQLERVNQAFEGFCNPLDIQIIAGDLGINQSTKEYKIISKEWVDVWSKLKPREAGLTYDPKQNKMTKSLNSSALPSRRDRILYKSKAITINPTEVQILGTTRLEEKYKGAHIWPSDHFALLASISLPTDPSASYKPSSQKEKKCVIS